MKPIMTLLLALLILCSICGCRAYNPSMNSAPTTSLPYGSSSRDTLIMSVPSPTATVIPTFTSTTEIEIPAPTTTNSIVIPAPTVTDSQLHPSTPRPTAPNPTASPVEIDPTVENEMKEAFQNRFSGGESMTVWRLRYFGQYGRCHVAFFDLYGYGAFDVLVTDVIGGFEFRYTSTQSLYVYCDGKILTLEQAYQNGSMSDGELEALYLFFSSYYAYLYIDD